MIEKPNRNRSFASLAPSRVWFEAPERIVLHGLIVLLMVVAALPSMCTAATLEVIAVEGAPSPIPGENYSIDIFNFPPSLNDLGQLAFRSGNGSRVYRGNQTGVELITRQGDPFDSGTKLVDIARTPIAINNAGQMATNMRWDLPTHLNTNDHAMVLFANGRIDTAALDGLPEPTGDGSIFLEFNSWPALNASGQLAFTTVLGSTSGGDSDNTALYRWQPDTGNLTELVREGDTVPGGNGVFKGEIGSFNTLPSPVMNDAGHVSFVGSISGSGVFDDQGIYLATGNSLTEIVRRKTPTPDFASTNRIFDEFEFWRPSINNAGQVAFVAEYDDLDTSPNGHGIYAYENGVINRIAETGYAAPDFDGWFATNMDGIEINDQGQTVFHAEVKSATTGHKSPGIFVGGTDTLSARKIAILGESAPNDLGTFAQISNSQYALNDNDQVAYLTWVDILPGQSGGKIEALILDSGTDGVETIALEGMEFLGSVIEDLSFAGTYARGSDWTDEYQGLNNQGQVAFAFELADGREGIALWSPDLPGLLGDYNGNGVVDAADYTVWLNSLGSSTDLAADGNGNNLIDQADYTVWKSNFGNTASGGTGNGDAVPEPGALVLAILAMAGIVSRRL